MIKVKGEIKMVRQSKRISKLKHKKSKANSVDAIAVGLDTDEYTDAHESADENAQTIRPAVVNIDASIAQNQHATGSSAATAPSDEPLLHIATSGDRPGARGDAAGRSLRERLLTQDMRPAANHREAEQQVGSRPADLGNAKEPLDSRNRYNGSISCT